MAGFSFGTNPATTNTGSFSFGSNATFGSGSTTTATGGLTFGTPNANVAPTGGLGAATAQPTGGFTFGSTSTPAAPAASTPGGLTFGAGGGGGGLTFKSPTTATATPAQNTGTGFSFGVTGQQPQLSFGGTTATTSVAPPATTGLSFFSTPTSSAAVPQTSIGFGTTPQLGTTTAGSLFATPSTAQTALTFNAPTSSTAAKPSTLPVLSFGGTATAATTANTGAGGLSFGFSTPAAKTTASTGFTLGAPSTGTTGIFGFPSATTSTVPGTTATATPAPVFKGLGGVDTTQNTTGIGGGPTGGTGGRSENKTAKENQVPNDFIQSIDAYKSFVKTQKNLSCEVARTSVKLMAKVTADTQSLQQLLSTLSANIHKNNTLADRLKLETSKGFALCEMAQRTHDTPAGLQNDNTAPFEFFVNLVAKFEQNVQMLRQEIDNTEKHVNTLSQSSVLAPQELSMALKRLHESFVALAGRLQAIHQSVVTQRERHLSLRRHFLKDATDIFAKSSGDVNKKSGVAAGPTPFSAMGTVQTLGMLASQDKTISSFPGGSATVPGWGTTQTATPVPSLGSTGTSFIGSPSFSTTTDNSNFQLLKPPPGNKRGKR